jgi:aryl-alcohol dehydrogenase-like predicted oxidoreductase
MQQRTIGQSGLHVSAVGLGCNNIGRLLDLEHSRDLVNKALDLGIDLFDCADVYGGRGGAETMLGEILGQRRKDIVLITKFGRRMDDAGRKLGGSRRYIIEACEASLKRLKTDWIDLYMMHDTDPRTPIEETLRALDDLVRQGKVRYTGSSHFAAWQNVEAHWTAKANGLNHFIACEDEYSALHRGVEDELIPAAKACGVGLLPFYPLASGMLTGKYKAGAPLPQGSRMQRAERDYESQFFTPENWARMERLTAYAQSRGHTLLELAMSWLMAKPVVSSVIAGATRPEQIEANVKAAEWKMTPEEVAAIDAI